jgi:hypothetical protein
MIGSVADIVRRLLTVLPGGWFSDPVPPPGQGTILQALLAGFAAAWSAMYGLLADVQLLARIRTACGAFLDLIAVDFFGDMLARRPGESDASFQQRILQELLRPRGTRSAVIAMITELTGNAPAIFEPGNPADTGGYTVGGVGYGAGGGWGSLRLPYASFITITPPAGMGIAEFAGYGTGGYSYYGDLDMVASPVTDAMIFAAIEAVLPSGYVAWTRLTS